MNRVYLIDFKRLYFLSTFNVDNLWITVLVFAKSNIFTTVLSEMPFFYTAKEIYNYK
jgi:hypothetical protein